MLTEPIKTTIGVSSSTGQGRPPTVAVPGGKSGSHQETTQDIPFAALKEAAGNLQSTLNLIHNVDLQFSIHQASGRVMVTVKDASTGKVLREVPPQELLDLAAKMDEMIGLIFDKRG
jgi:flagellar protein FlaG